MYYVGNMPYDPDYLEHHGILGMKWGVRRYQNEDGTYTSAGRRRYGIGAIRDSITGTIKNRMRDAALSREFGRTIRNYDRIHDIRTHNTLKDRAKRAFGNAVEKAKSGAREAGETARAYGESARLAGISAKIRIGGAYWNSVDRINKTRQGASVLAKALGRAGSTTMSAVLGGNKYTRSGVNAVHNFLNKHYAFDERRREKNDRESWQNHADYKAKEWKTWFDSAKGPAPEKTRYERIMEERKKSRPATYDWYV